MKFQKLAAVALGGLMLFSLCACGESGNGGFNGGNDDDIVQAADDDRSGWVAFNKATFPEGTQLNIKFFNGGYGRAWIDAMKAKFEEDYPGVTVNLTPSTNETEFTQTIATTLDNQPDDIYICHNIPYERLSQRNLVMNLNNLYNSVIYTDTNNDDAPIRFVDRIDASALNVVRFNGNFVAIPEIQGVGGIAYNVALFEKYGWEVPQTYEELVALCETITGGDYESLNGEKVYPFVWAGTEAYMWDSFVYDMWVQIAGLEEYQAFMKYDTKDMYDSEKYPALKQAWSYWYDLVAAKPENSHPQTAQLNYMDSLNSFAAGQGAMMPASCWTGNEVPSAMLEAFGADVGLIPTPFVKEAKKDENGDPIRVAYNQAGKDCMIIAQKGKNKQVAVEFFKWMALEENARLFPLNTNGLHLAFKYDFSTLKDLETSVWAKTEVEALLTATRFNHYSNSPLVLNQGTPLSPYPEGNMYLEAYTNYGTADERTPDGVFASRWEYIQANWDMMCQLAGVTP